MLSGWFDDARIERAACIPSEVVFFINPLHGWREEDLKNG